MKKSKLRIISGKWRRRQIQFISDSAIRPTTDSARETLFNWLGSTVNGARCLDLFAGSGALGFEALSRGAEFVVFVDKVRNTVRSIEDNCHTLETAQYAAVMTDALDYLKNSQERFDIVFIDPPFNTGLASRAIELLDVKGCLNPGAQIYAEQERRNSEISLPKSWKILREYRTSNRSHSLYQFNR